MRDLRSWFVSGTTAEGTAPPYVIAEIGVNHEGSVERAKEMVSAIARAGGDAAKFQTYKAERLASRHSPAYWDTTKEPTQSQYQLFKKHDGFGEAQYRELAAHCRSVGVDFLSTPFDLEAVEFLDPLVPAFKIASADLTNVPLLRAVAGRDKPVILSTGASTLPEIAFAVDVLERGGCRDLALLHCVLSYPTPDQDAHLNMILGLKRAFPDRPIGYSDHTVPDPGMTVLLSAFLKGAVIIEKHFTFDKSLPGNDHYHAMDEADLRTFLSLVGRAAEAAGSLQKRPVEGEAAARLHARRSIVARRDLRAGEELREEDLICKRPGHGISPVFWDDVVGRVLAHDVAEDQILAWDDLAEADAGLSSLSPFTKQGSGI